MGIMPHSTCHLDPFRGEHPSLQRVLAQAPELMGQKKLASLLLSRIVYVCMYGRSMKPDDIRPWAACSGHPSMPNSLRSAKAGLSTLSTKACHPPNETHRDPGAGGLGGAGNQDGFENHKFLQNDVSQSLGMRWINGTPSDFE